MTDSGDSRHSASMIDRSKTCSVPGFVPCLPKPSLRRLGRLTQAPKHFASTAGATQVAAWRQGHGDADRRHRADITMLPQVARIAEQDNWRAIDPPREFATRIWGHRTGPLQTSGCAAAVTTLFALRSIRLPDMEIDARARKISEHDLGNVNRAGR